MVPHIGFSDTLVNDVLNGTKTCTFRLGSKYAENLKKGMVVNVLNSHTKKIFGKAKIVDIQLKTLSQVPLDQSGHEGYISINELIKSLQSYYPDEKVDVSSIVSIIEFQLL